MTEAAGIDRRYTYVVTNKIVPGLARGVEFKVHAEDDDGTHVFVETFEDRPTLVDGVLVKQKHGTLYRITRNQFDTKAEAKQEQA
jgi:hypothetical protein